MIEVLLIGLLALAGLVALVLGLVLLPLMLIGGLLKLVLTLVCLPFKILGGLFHFGASVLGGLARLLLGLVALLAVAVAAFGGLVLLPLIPLLLVGGTIWLVVRLFRGSPARHVDVRAT